ncbi:MAG: hypothetical protein ND866_27665 [Pyrinomonadaceae bacterium]|nr:hypothetical protein [Pyrinomonadaceae bacterium]
MADNLGTVHTDPTFIADRQVIINYVMAFSYLIDEGCVICVHSLTFQRSIT